MNVFQDYFLKCLKITEIPESLLHDWNWAWENTQPSLIVFANEFKKNQYKIQNFIYDRYTGLVFCNFESGNHYNFTIMLEQMYQGKTEITAKKEHLDNVTGTWPGYFYDFSELYIRGCRGVMLSSISTDIYKSNKFVLNTKDDMFEDYDGKIWKLV